MDTEDVLLPGGRDVRGTLDRAADSRAEAAVVACPPHPQHGGSRTNPHLRSVGEALANRGVDCLRFDYGDWAEGRGEQTDARTAVTWVRERYDRVGLFGYSFGGGIAILVVGDSEDPLAVDCLSTLAPHSLEGFAVEAAVPRIEVPAQLLYGSDDDTADWEGIADAAREAGWSLQELSGGHFFRGQAREVGEAVGEFLAPQLR